MGFAYGHAGDWNTALMELPEANFYAGSLTDLIKSGRPLLDVRASIEYQQGAFAQSTNIPLLDNLQRERVGKVYKQQGHKAAVALGLKLATDEIKRDRLEAWAAWYALNPGGVLYCFRGGMRSRISQAWLREIGIEIPLVVGGYKALRQTLLEVIDHAALNFRWLVIAGRTGVGKTEVVLAAQNSIDLEGLAVHRGSAFGACFEPQPTQIDFEHRLAAVCLQLDSQRPVIIEDEGRTIGRIALPIGLYKSIKESAYVQVETTEPQRVTRLCEDYVGMALTHFQTHRAEPWSALADFVQQGLDKIKKRLGGQRYSALSVAVEPAVEQLSLGDWSGFQSIVSSLLNDYYDALYDYQMQQYQRSMIFNGDADSTINYVNNAK